jgi:hypothetical protein
MKAANLARRLQKLEAVRQPFDIFGNMSIEQLREFISVTLQDMGGKDAALIELRNDPGVDPDTIKMVEDWPARRSEGLAGGVAHIALKGHAVLYNGGRSQPLTIEEWQAQHCVGEADKSVH